VSSFVNFTHDYGAGGGIHGIHGNNSHVGRIDVPGSPLLIGAASHQIHRRKVTGITSGGTLGTDLRQLPSNISFTDQMKIANIFQRSDGS